MPYYQKWNEELVKDELKKVINDISHFPTYSELEILKKHSLSFNIVKYGGINKFRTLFGYDLIRQQNGYWTYENIIKEIQNIIDKTGHFPTDAELKDIKKSKLSNIIHSYGGITKFRTLMKYELSYKPDGYWTNESIIKKLKEVISELGHFPTHSEFKSINIRGLEHAISEHGGFTKFRKLMGYKLLQKPRGYWNDEVIVNELKEICTNLGHFPTQKELISISQCGLSVAVAKHGGLTKYCLLFNYDLNKTPRSYWNDKIIVKELKIIVDKLNHFPTKNELISMERCDLWWAIRFHGGINKFRETCGYTVSMYDRYISELMSYTGKRGKKTEDLVKQILCDYCSLHNLLLPQYNKKLARGNVIEFICNTNKTIGIDVTNTKRKSTVCHKWTHKQYHLHLDELWIVIFSDVFSFDDYNRFNNESPDNVKVFSIYGFLKELDYSLSENMKNKIDKYCSCTFHSKDDLKIKYKVIL